MSEPQGPHTGQGQGPSPAPCDALATRHLRFGWWAMLAFATLGIALEALHAFKAQLYLGVEQDTRRLMWTLAHAHGVGLSLLHMGFGATLKALTLAVSTALVRAGQLLTWGSVFVPLGFALGGLTAHEGDPGLGIILVPVGALCLWIALITIALAVQRRQGGPAEPAKAPSAEPETAP